MYCFVFQAEDGIRDLVRSRGLGDVYKRQTYNRERFDEAHDFIIKAWTQDGPWRYEGKHYEYLSLIHI